MYLSLHALWFVDVQVFLILSEPDVVLPLAYVILTGDTSLSLPPLLTQAHPAAVRMSTAVSLDLPVPIVPSYRVTSERTPFPCLPLQW